VVRPRPDVTQTKPARFSDEAGDLHRPVLLVDVWTIIVRNVEELAVGCQPALQVLDSASGHPRVSRRLIRPRNNFFAGLRGEGLRQQGAVQDDDADNQAAASSQKPPPWQVNAFRDTPSRCSLSP